MEAEGRAPRFFGEADGSPEILRSRRIAILGYGNQGRAQALNLRDQDIRVLIGLREGSRSASVARGDGLETASLPEAVSASDVVFLLLPDEVQAGLFRTVIAPHLAAGSVLGFAHGFALRFGGLQPPGDVDVVLVAPKGPGSALRANFLRGSGLPALLSVEQDVSGRARETALAWAAGVGCLRCGAMEVSARLETEADLFGEQAVLCGGVHALAEAAFDALVEAGFPPALAYIECVQELKAMVDRMFDHGPDGMWEGASGTARYGGLTRGTRVIGPETRAELRRILDEVRSGRFAAEWMEAARSPGFSWASLRRTSHAVDEAGREVRSRLRWRADPADAPHGTGPASSGEETKSP